MEPILASASGEVASAPLSGIKTSTGKAPPKFWSKRPRAALATLFDGRCSRIECSGGTARYIAPKPTNSTAEEGELAHQTDVGEGKRQEDAGDRQRRHNAGRGN